MNRVVLLTGGSGFIGRNLLESKFTEHYQVLAPSHAELELGDEVAVRRYIDDHNVTLVVHSAIKPAHRAATDTSGVLSENLRYFYALKRNLDRLEKIVIIGSGSVYDYRHYKMNMSESDFDQSVPRDDLGLFKYAINQSIETSQKIYDLRVFGVYGPHEDYRIRFPSNLICKALLGVPMTMRQDRWFDYIYVEDLIPVIQWVLDAEPEHRAYNVTSGSPLRLAMLAELIRELTGTRSSIQIEQPGMGSAYTGDSSLLRSENPRLQFRSERDGIKALIAWYSERLSSLDRQVFLKDY